MARKKKKKKVDGDQKNEMVDRGVDDDVRVKVRDGGTSFAENATQRGG